MSSRSTKRARIVEEPAYVTTDGEVKPYLPVEITKAREAYAASLDVLFKHVADFHVMIVQILADKYKLDEEEMLSAIKDDPRYTGMMSQPKLNPLGYFKDVDATAAGGRGSDEGIFEESDTEVAAVTDKVGAMKISLPTRICGFPCAGDCMSCELHDKIHGKDASLLQPAASFTPGALPKKKIAVRCRPKKPTGGAAGGASS